jgi:hypothetical protein
VPYFEDSQKAKIAGRGTEKSIAQLQREIIDLLTRLGAHSITFVSGVYPAQTKRYGFQVLFVYGSLPGRIDCAALPMRSEAPKKKDRAQAQALYLLRLELEAQSNAWVYKPGAVPLVPYLIGAGNKTVTEALVETKSLPVMNVAGYLP